MRQLRCSPPRATARSSSPGKRWPGAKQERPLNSRLKNKAVTYTPLGLDLDKATSVESALAELVKQGKPIDFLLLNAGLVPFKERAALLRASRLLRPR